METIELSLKEQQNRNLQKAFHDYARRQVDPAAENEDSVATVASGPIPGRATLIPREFMHLKGDRDATPAMEGTLT